MYIICTSSDVALRIARMIRDGVLPCLYRTEAMAVEAWRMQTLPMQARYSVWRVIGSCALLIEGVQKSSTN